MGTKPTLHEVAAAAGVSLASASRALTGRSASPEMVRKVRMAAKRIGYLPDATARSLRLGGRPQVVFAVDDIGNPNYVQMLRAIEEELGETTRISVSATGRRPDQTVELVRMLSMGAGDGLIISPLRVTPALRQALADTVVPVVVIGTLHSELSIDSVFVDSAVAVGMVVDHLVEIGRTGIGVINGPGNTNPGAARRSGFAAAAERHGLTRTEALQVTAADFTVGAGVDAAERLLAATAESGERIDAIVCANDLIAIGAINAIRRQGLRVPEDIAVTGIDDTDLAGLYSPPLTSVSLQSERRGRIAARMLSERFADPSRPTRRETVEATLVVRASTIGESA
ncbi:LacI family DNA-binding transcriptional regulator [Microbacterium sp. MYb62]|uniref:LacI family DNA-binding transcriptional regulator n=1 Tax=Microbacterium sp. MYb62 TaxID=1848690 RepID=UPI000CFDEC23|nr:LacI family DNA-binding transcriptional regulator [Microbacterium sp. MYb62]PRB18363.1 LacI family transcriptional regulator [Microbacterium sp. MYb62]